MQLTVQHTTHYRFNQPVSLLPHRLMLTPRGSHDVAILTSSVSCSPKAQLDWSQDVFGNVITKATFTEPASELIINSELTVEHLSAAWPIFSIAPEAHSYPFHYSDDDLLVLGAFRTPEHLDQEARLNAWSRAFIHAVPTDTLSLLKDLNAGSLGPLTYRVRDEEGTQLPIDTLALGSGSCRDIASLFIEAARHLGFAARAVSGYLFDPQTTAEDAGSTHAWAEVYLPGAGWVAFDPTHGRLGQANLIPVATGRSNSQLMPVSGGYLGTPGSFSSMDVRVDVRPVS